MLFTDFVLDLDSQYDAGYSYICMIAFHVAVILIYIVSTIVKDVIYQRKKKIYKNNALKRKDQILEDNFKKQITEKVE